MKGIFVLVFSILLLATASVAAPSYNVSILGSLSGTSNSWSWALDINEAGKVVGRSQTSSPPAEHAFVWTNGRTSDLGTLESWYSNAASINDQDVVAGNSYDPATNYPLACAWTESGLSDLGIDAHSSYATGINNNGDIVGGYINDQGYQYGFFVSGDEFTTIGLRCTPHKVNEQGQVVGTIDEGGNQPHAFMWSNGTLTDLTTLYPELSHSYGASINNLGQIVGTKLVYGVEHGFIIDNGKLVDLGCLRDNGGSSSASDINDLGQIVGTSDENYGKEFRHAFLYQNGTMQDIGPIGKQSSACAINNLGQIVGEMELPGFVFQATIWQPIPEPSSLLALGIGAIGFAGLWRRRKE